MKSFNQKSDFIKRIFTSCFGLGLLPGAQGSFGSLPAALIFAAMIYLGANTMLVTLTMGVLMLAGAYVCIFFAPAIIRATGKNDPSEIVADEIAGQAAAFIIVLLPAAATNFRNESLIIAGAGFLLFRFFDIAKPFPIRRLEKLSVGTGIIADDLMAGLYAGLSLFIAVKAGLIDYIYNLGSHKISEINNLVASFLGTLQGLTEFLPVSSSGHLALFEHIFGLNPEKTEILLFDLVIHTGTVIAIFIVFRKSIISFLENLIRGCKNLNDPVGLYTKNFGVRFFILAFVATVVTAVPGFMLKKYFESARGSIATISVMWIITGILLTATDFRKTRMSLRKFGLAAAIIIGLFQAVAIMPGISRSGATIVAAILIGLRRRWAVEFSFLLAIPAILGATAVEFIKNFDVIGAGHLSTSVLLTGFAASVLTGIVALKILLRLLKVAKLSIFAVYCFALASFVLIYCLR
jgi:undecaprenyl-diphosphatase